MKLITSSIFRSIVAIVIGVLLIQYGMDSLKMLCIAIPVVGSINQFIRLIEASRLDRIGVGYWLSPIAIILVGLVVILRPDFITEDGDYLKLIGWMVLVYGIVESVISLKIFLIKKKAEQNDALLSEESEDSEELSATAESTTM